MTPRSKPTQKHETAIVQSPQLPLPLNFDPVPDDAVQRLLSKLFELAIKKGNIPAAKLLLDALKEKSADPAALTVEGALKILQEHIAKAA